MCTDKCTHVDVLCPWEYWFALIFFRQFFRDLKFVQAQCNPPEQPRGKALSLRISLAARSHVLLRLRLGPFSHLRSSVMFEPKGDASRSGQTSIGSVIFRSERLRFSNGLPSNISRLALRVLLLAYRFYCVCVYTVVTDRKIACLFYPK